MKIITVIALIAAAALATPALASATTYCVGDSGGTCDVSKLATGAGLQAALTEADGSGGVSDVVRIGPGTYTGNFTYSSTDELDVQGSGTATVIRGVGIEPALWVSASGSDSVVSGIKVEMAGVTDPHCAAGLRIGSAVGEGLRVENPADSCGAGIDLQPDGHVLNSTVLAGAGMGIQDSGGAGQRVVSDSFIAGRHAVSAATGTWTLKRLRVTGRVTGIVAGGNASLENSLVRVSGEAGVGSVGVGKLGPGVFAADHVTIVGGPQASYGVSVAIAVPGTSTLSLKNSILAGIFQGSSFIRSAEGGGTAKVVVGHSNFAPPTSGYVDGSRGPGVFQETPDGTNSNLDPKFVDPVLTLENPTVDFRLRHDSPLIDRGEPGGVQGMDLARELRLVDGDGDGADEPTRDMGAYEYQRRSPTAVIAAPGMGPFAVGAPVAFSAAGSGDPDAGDSLEYAWSFGDGTTAPGAAASHAYESGGPRTVTLTVTDPTGLSATATGALLVEAPLPGSGSGSGTGTGSGTAGADRVAPALSSVFLSAPAFRVDARAAAAGRVPRGTRVRFSLSEAASVRFTIRRRSGGRRIGGFLRSAGAGVNSVRFAGRLRVRGRTRSLAPGRYRLTIVARDAAGNRSVARRVAFRVVRA